MELSEFSGIVGPLLEYGVSDPRFRLGSRSVIRKTHVSAGDLVVLFENWNSMVYVTVEPGKYHQGRKGSFKLDRLLGLPYGSVLYSDKPSGGFKRSQRKRKPSSTEEQLIESEEDLKSDIRIKNKETDCSNFGGWVLVLQPSPELWTASLNHRTQILYSADISLILLYLEIKPGSIVFESGTGSGSLSTAFVQTIAPTGHLYTFEFNESRVNAAKEDFSRIGIDKFITVTHRDVVGKGFGIETVDGEEQDLPKADAIFLDLPKPWEVLNSVDSYLVPNGKFCSFSPCIEQVQRTCEGLAAMKYIEINTVECLNRSYMARTFPMPKLDLVEEAQGIEDECEHPFKHRKTEAFKELQKVKRMNKKSRETTEVVALGSRPFNETRGHTGYLTFARKAID